SCAALSHSFLPLARRHPLRLHSFPTRRSSDLLAAASSARWRRLVRMVSECTRSACATLVPNLSVCTSMMTSEEMSSSAVRFARRSEEHTSELQSQSNLVCRLLLEKKKGVDGQV